MKCRNFYDTVTTLVVKYIDERLFGTNNHLFREKSLDWKEIQGAYNGCPRYEELSEKFKKEGFGDGS